MMNRCSKSTISTSKLNFLNSRLNKLDKSSTYILISFVSLDYFHKEWKSKTYHTETYNKIKSECKRKLQTPKFVTFNKINSKGNHVYWIVIESKYCLKFLNPFLYELDRHVFYNSAIIDNFETLFTRCNQLLSLPF